MKLEDSADVLPEDCARVFLSYSRKDRERASAIADILRERHFGVFRDTDDILPTEEWKGRLEQLIEEADTIVFLLSPHSVVSEVCAWEVEYATSLNKRIAPIVIEEVDSAQIPSLLARLNFIFCTARDPFRDAIDTLVSALNTDIDWIREHTRLAGLASRWENAGRPSRLLLRGQDVADAENWRDSRPGDAPTVTPLHAAFVTESRRTVARKQRLVVGFSIAGALFALGLAGFAYLQREAAVEAQASAERERDAAQTNQSKLLTRFAMAELQKGLPVDAALLALEALPDPKSTQPSRRDRPLVDESQVFLRKAGRAITEEAVVIRLDGAVNRMTLSPEGRFLVAQSTDAGQIEIYDRTAHQTIGRWDIPALRGAVDHYSFRMDGTVVAVAGGDGAVWLLPTDPEKKMNRIEVSDLGLSHAAFVDRDRVLLASTYDDKVLGVRPKDGSVIYTVPESTIAVSPGRERFAATIGGEVRLYDAATGSIIATLDRKLEGAVNFPNMLTFSPDGKWLAVSSDLFTWLLDGETLRALAQTQRKLSQLAVGFSPDSAWLHVTGTDGEAIIYNLTEKEIFSHHKEHRGWLFDLTYNQSKNLIASASNDGSIQVWNPISNAVLAELRGHAGGVRHVAFVNQGTAILSASEDGTVRRWRVPARAAARPALVEEYRGDPVYSRDRARVALSGAGIFDVMTGEVLQRGGPSYTGPGFLKFSDDGSLLLAFSRAAESGAQPDICLHDGLTGETLRCMLNSKTGNIWSADMDGEARTVVADVVDGEQRAIVSFDATTGRELGRLASRGGKFGEPVVSADGARILVHETNGPIRAFDRALAREVGTPIVASREFPLIHVHLPRRDRVILGWADGHAESRTLSNNELVTTFEFDSTWGQTIMPSPSEDFLVTRMRRGGLEVWNADSGKLVATLPAIGPDRLADPMFLPGERYLAASSGATTIVWDLESGLELERFEMDFDGSHPSVFVKGYSADGSRIVTWSWAGPKQWLFQRDAYEVIASAQERISRCLHPEQRRRFGLVLVPPRWCITGAGKEGLSDPDSWQPKWPYHTEAWREWLAARDRGEERPLPQ